nr:hypothetical protein [Tanacetum cinerariifolium]
ARGSGVRTARKPPARASPRPAESAHDHRASCDPDRFQ